MDKEEQEEEFMAVKATVGAADTTSLVDWIVDSEGPYKVNHWMTRSGSYSIYASSPSGFALLGSPAAISVTSSSAVVMNSYVYDQVAQGTAGRTSNLYVQVRDEFGNKLTDMSSFEDMQVNLRLKLGGTQGEACGGLNGF